MGRNKHCTGTQAIQKPSEEATPSTLPDYQLAQKGTPWTTNITVWETVSANAFPNPCPLLHSKWLTPIHNPQSHGPRSDVGSNFHAVWKGHSLIETCAFTWSFTGHQWDTQPSQTKSQHRPNRLNPQVQVSDYGCPQPTHIPCQPDTCHA
jgi:hypothetical protein